jgi:hypothetical protein
MLDYSDKAILREAHGLETAKIIGPDAEAGDT